MSVAVLAALIVWPLASESVWLLWLPDFPKPF